MTWQNFDRDFWNEHWAERGAMASAPPNPYVVRETASLVPGTAVDAGCGAGAEAVWLAAQGWQVTAVDLVGSALARGAERAGETGVAVTWVEADLAGWEPPTAYDLVVSSYAHPAMPQLDFYTRLATWVAPGGTLLVVGHRQPAGGAGHGHGPEHGHPPEHATVGAEEVTALLAAADWEVVTAAEEERTTHGRTLQDVVVRARRRH